jgi:polyphosphate kinase
LINSATASTPFERDVLLYYPYHTFEHVLELLRQASFDPSVLAIKINIYRGQGFAHHRRDDPRRPQR